MGMRQPDKAASRLKIVSAVTVPEIERARQAIGERINICVAAMLALVGIMPTDYFLILATIADFALALAAVQLDPWLRMLDLTSRCAIVSISFIVLWRP